MANERIKANAKATPEAVGAAVMASVKVPVHKEKVPQKIYVGPNRLGLPKYTVVESIEVPHVQNFIKECPEIAHLFVEIDKMAETEVRVKQKGTLEHRYYNVVAQFTPGKGDK